MATSFSLKQGETRTSHYIPHPLNLWNIFLDHHLECYKDKTTGTDYRGYVNQTKSGTPCQKWTTQSPHEHEGIVPCTYPEKGLGDHNYCRNPNKRPDGPWCYTTDPDKEWEYCDVGKPKKSCKSKGMWKAEFLFADRVYVNGSQLAKMKKSIPDMSLP